jgi:glycosyltransferase involved in cell wall biosynthesis
MKRLDVVAPVFNEEACLERFHAELSAALRGLPYRWRLILVDDGSTDGTPELCRALAARDPAVQYVRLSRNFGHQAALTAGLDVADADAVVTMDSDLQHPPSAIPAFVEAWERGAELVAGVRGEAELPLAKRLLSRAFYRVLNRVSNVPIVPDAPDFRLLDAKVVAAIRSMREQSRFLRGMYSWIGFRQVAVPYRQAGRAAGRSKYDTRQMGRLALAAMLSFSRAPLRLATWVGLGVSLLSFAYGVYAIVQAVVLRATLPGWPSLAVLISFLSGIQLLTLGLFGEYLGQVLDESKRRPLYLVAESTVTRDARTPGAAEPSAAQIAGAR